jgi:hypothetical protein
MNPTVELWGGLKDLISIPSGLPTTLRYERKDPIPAWAAAIQDPRSSMTIETCGVVPADVAAISSMSRRRPEPAGGMMSG